MKSYRRLLRRRGFNTPGAWRLTRAVCIAAVLSFSWIHESRAAELYLSLQAGESFTTAVPQPDPPGSPANAAALKSTGSLPTLRGAVGLHLGQVDLELGAGSLARYQLSRNLDGCGEGCDTSGYNLTANELDLRVRVWVPVSEHFSLYVQGGEAYLAWRTEQWCFSDTPMRGQGHIWSGGWVPQSGENFSPQFGAGAGYELSRHWTLQADVTDTTNVRGADVVQIGLGARYTFR